METSKLKLRPAVLSVESFDTQGGARKEGTLVGGQDPRALRGEDAARESGGATCAGVTCWETCGRTCYATCSLLDCGF